MAHQVQNCGVHADNDVDLTIALPGVDWSTATVYWSMRRHPLSDTVIIEKSSSDPAEIETASPATDQALVHLSASDLHIAPGIYYHGSLVTDGGGNDSTILHGTIEVSPKYST